MLSDKDKIFIFEIIKTASAQEIKEISRKCAEILSKESKTPKEDFKSAESAYYIGPSAHAGLSYGHQVKIYDILEKHNIASIGYTSDDLRRWPRTAYVRISELSKTHPDKEKSQFPFMYYIGNDADELKYIKFGERVEIISTPEKYGENQSHPHHFVVKTINGAAVVVSRANLSTEPPLQGATNYSTGSASSDFLNEIRSRIEDRIKAAGGDKNAISQLSSGVIIPSQNPTALILRQMADRIDSGCDSIVKSDYVIRRDDNGVRTIVSVEIFESAGGDRE